MGLLMRQLCSFGDRSRLSSNRVSLNEIREIKKIHLIMFLVLECSFTFSLFRERFCIYLVCRMPAVERFDFFRIRESDFDAHSEWTTDRICGYGYCSVQYINVQCAGRNGCKLYSRGTSKWNYTVRKYLKPFFIIVFHSL